MHYSCALFPYISLRQFIFFHVPLFSCCAFFKLRHFHVTIFYVIIFSCCTFFGVSLFLCIALFHIVLFHNVFLLHFSPVTLFVACCIFFLLHFLPVVLFQRWSQDFHKHLRWRALQQLTKPLNIVSQLSILDVHGVLTTPLLFPWCAFSMLHFLSLFSCSEATAAFACCTFLILKNIENEQKTENTTRKVLIGSFCSHHAICLTIGFWYGSFVWKWCIFNLSAFN